MTQQEQDQLTDLQSKYNAALANYNQELQDYANYGNGLQGAQAGTDNGHNAAWWQMMFNASKGSLTAKKQVMDQASSAVAAFQLQLNQQAQNAYAQNNPQLYADIVKNKDTVTAKSAADQAAAQADAASKLYMQKSTMYLIGGLCLVVLVIAGIIMFKNSSK